MSAATILQSWWTPSGPYSSSDVMKKVSEKAGKIPSTGDNHRKDLSCHLARQKRVHLWNTSKCSLPFSPGKWDTTTQQCRFLLAKVLIRKSECIATCHMELNNASTHIFAQMLLTAHCRWHQQSTSLDAKNSTHMIKIVGRNSSSLSRSLGPT